MNVQLTYTTDYIEIKDIAVVGEFNNFNPKEGKMKKEDGRWILNLDVSPGEYRYRFLINETLSVNDPTANIYAPDDEEKLWSVLLINEEKQQLYNNQQYNLHLDAYSLTSTVTKEDIKKNKKEFNVFIDEKVVTRFDFTDITGLHTVTAAWYTPMGELYQFSENILFKDDTQDTIKIWFWLDIKGNKENILSGDWTMKLFINGSFILEDKFKILKENSYSYIAKQKHNYI